MIVAHEVTNVGHDRAQLTAMSKLARDAIGGEQLTVLADRGYFDGEEILQVRRGENHAAGAQADNFKQPSRWAFRQARLHLHRGPRRVPLPGWRTGNLAHDHGREWPKDAPVLAVGLPALPDQVAMHTQRLPPNRALGTRAGAGRHAAPPGSRATSVTLASADRGASLRDAEGMDGGHSLPDQDLASGSNGNEPACPGVQPEAGAEPLRNATSGCVHEGVTPRPSRDSRFTIITAPNPPSGRQPRSRLAAFSHSLGRKRPSSGVCSRPTAAVRARRGSFR